MWEYEIAVLPVALSPRGWISYPTGTGLLYIWKGEHFMIKLTLPDGSVREAEAGTSILDVVKGMSNSLAKKALAGHEGCCAVRADLGR